MIQLGNISVSTRTVLVSAVSVVIVAVLVWVVVVTLQRSQTIGNGQTSESQTPVEQCQSLWGQLNTNKYNPATCSTIAQQITDLNCYALTQNAVYADPQKKVCDVTQCQSLWGQLTFKRGSSECVGLVMQITNLNCFQLTQNSVYNIPDAKSYCSSK